MKEKRLSLSKIKSLKTLSKFGCTKVFLYFLITQKKGGQSSSLFKARFFECNNTNHLVADCPKAIEKEKGALEAKLEASKKEKKKGKGLIGNWDQDSSESEEEEKANICFMALENEVQSSPSNSSKLIDDICEDDPYTMLIEMYGECKKVSKRNKELKNKNNFLLDENSKLICENKYLLESLEILKDEKECSNNDFRKLVLENKKFCEKVYTLEKSMVDYDVLKKKVSDLTICVEKFTKGKENFEKILASQRLPFDKNGIGYNNSNNFSKQTQLVVRGMLLS
ncbi:hypothetical protein M9H77_14098 [Catharanthus roseus]|uniref:Uncharacterized protein n=1 Tax=Catharanthus roseus TaxID=4058 RepID=A0ACC0BMC9_CATRO|nr:hypothetical protein M9H77_14098 [Catharanthus roseus]